ncbi:hypothetical protein BFN10_17365 [Pseudomonas extremorientalis]|uniref:Uncharacterized protein n=1 Tax=Pseudomonas extremorientalis TaxID=169669 RepID=A0A1S2TGD7_9PSED|nr:hypothetical protein BFN10_17365 [Pseudomonas extremorientalis]
MKGDVNLHLVFKNLQHKRQLKNQNPTHQFRIEMRNIFFVEIKHLQTRYLKTASKAKAIVKIYICMLLTVMTHQATLLVHRLSAQWESPLQPAMEIKKVICIRSGALRVMI